MESQVKWSALIAACLLILTTVGCGGTAVEETKEDLSSLGSLLSDLRDDPESLSRAFSSSATIADPSAYRKYMYHVEEAKVSGDTATVNMHLWTNDLEEKDLGVHTWKAIKEGDVWKLIEAPLPQ